MNNLLYIVCNFLYTDISGACSKRPTFLYSFKGSNTQLYSALPTHFDCIFLTSQTSSEDVSLENEWLGFLSLRVKEAG